jgi:hypothetical protein
MKPPQIRPPGFFHGSPEEWAAVPPHQKEMWQIRRAKERDAVSKEIEQWHAAHRGSLGATPGTPSTAARPEPALRGIRNWNEAVPPFPASRIRSSILYLLDVKRDAWYRANLNNRAFVLRNAVRMNDATPEDFEWNPKSIIGWRSRPIADSDERMVEKYIRRFPQDEAERVKIREVFGITAYSRPYLVKKGCPRCHGRGKYEVSPYADQPRLRASVICPCAEE